MNLTYTLSLTGPSIGVNWPMLCTFFILRKNKEAGATIPKKADFINGSLFHGNIRSSY